MSLTDELTDAGRYLSFGGTDRSEAHMKTVDAACERIEKLEAALRTCVGVLSNIPAPHSYALWHRMCDAIRDGRQALGEE